MKKYLLIILSFILLPVVVFAEECETTDDTWCVGQSCLSSLQTNYNTWTTTGNTGKTCIRVIAKRNGNNKTYLSGKDPQTNYTCSNGNVVTKKLVYSALSDSETNVTECQNDTCYIPEVWLMDCGTISLNGTGGNNSNNDSSNNSNNSSSNSSNSGNDSVTNNNNNGNNTGNNTDDVTTNDDGQITGTTDASDTGVETYFIVLFVMVMISYLILIVSKKKNLFKNI